MSTNFSSHGVQNHHSSNRNLGISSNRLNQEQNSLLRANNTKLDSANTTLESILVDTDACDSSLNTIEAQSVLTASRLNNIQNKISENADGTGNTLGELTVLTNTKLDTIATNTENIKISTDSVNLNVDTLEALQTTANTKLTEIDVVLDSIKTDSAAIKTAVEILDNAISGSEMQVDIVSSALATGASTAANQLTANGSLSTIANNTTSLDGKVTACDTGAVVVSSSALPSGAATQTTLAAILAKNTENEALLTSIKTAVELLDNTVSGNELQVDVVSAPTTTVNGTVIANLSATDNAVLDDIAQKLGDVETAVQLLDNAVSGNELQVDVVASLPAGDNNIGNVDIVTSALPTGASTESTLSAAEAHLGNIETSVQALDDIVKAEDAAHSNGDKGVMFLGVRQSSQADFGADGDYVPISINDDGEIRVTTGSGGGGDASASNQTTMIGHLSAIETDQAALEVLHTATNSKIDTLDSVLDAAEVHLGNIDGKITQGSDASLTNAQQVLIYGRNGTGALKPIHITNNGDVEVEIADMVKGQAAMAASFPVVIASDQSALTISASVLDNILIDTSAIKTDAAALEILQTSTNTKLDTLETTLTAIETDQAALEVLHTSTNSKLDTIDGVLDNIKVDTEAIETATEAIQAKQTVSETSIFSSQVISASGTATSSEITITNNTKDLSFLVELTTVSPSEIQTEIQFSNTSGGTFYGVPLSFLTTAQAGSGLANYIHVKQWLGKFMKVKVTNSSFSNSSTVTVKMFQ